LACFVVVGITPGSVRLYLSNLEKSWQAHGYMHDSYDLESANMWACSKLEAYNAAVEHEKAEKENKPEPELDIVV